ncbi:MAG: hypothetical protein R3F34_13905 [Planctomycetota bacterium]
MTFRTRVRKNEVGLVFRHGDLHRVLAPGRHRTRKRPFGPDEVEVVDVLVTRFEHPLLDVLLEETALREQLVVVDLLDHQRAFVWKDGRLFAIVGPGRHAFWNRPYRVEVEVVDVTATVPFEHPKLDAILRHEDAPKFFRAIRVSAGEQIHDVAGRGIVTKDRVTV